MISTRHIFSVAILVACLLNVVMSDDDDDEDLQCDQDTCYQPIVKGPCRGYIPRYAYDQDQGKCVKFIYGGCKGNTNNFHSMHDCLQTCEGCNDDDQDTCHQPMVVGPCKGSFLRYWYNHRTGKCEKFYYGGCGGNENNFKSLSVCRGTCTGYWY